MAEVTGNIAGIVLAAGKGRRMGTPKALLRFPDGAGYLQSACEVLHHSGAAPVLVVLGADAHEAAGTLPPREELPVETVLNPAWEQGMSTSLRAGLEAAQKHADVEAAIIHLVDLPDVREPAMRRIMSAAARSRGGPAAALVRARYDRRPGHPVLIGREHWAGVLASLDGDAGARGYLREHAPQEVDLSDLATGRDIDTPEERLRFEEEYRS